jgi:GDP-L-fucose synthase
VSDASLRVLLTGGSGMVGRNFLAHPDAGRYTLLAPRRSELDLLDAAGTRAFLREHRPDIVVHAAGRVGGIQANIAAPVAFLLDNLDMGRNLLQAAAEAGVPRVINLGSSCMYPRGHDEPLREEQLFSGNLEPTNEGYAIAKIAVARLGEYLGREHPGWRCRTLIPCNLYGPHDSFDEASSHLVPAILHKLHRAVSEGREVVDIWGDGSARREFMYAGDLADLLMRAIERFDELPDCMNVGPGTDHSVLDYYVAGAQVVGYRGRFAFDTSRPVGMARKLVDIARLRAFGWQAGVDLAAGLRLTYEHYLREHAPRGTR